MHPRKCVQRTKKMHHRLEQCATLEKHRHTRKMRYTWKNAPHIEKCSPLDKRKMLHTCKNETHLQKRITLLKNGSLHLDKRTTLKKKKRVTLGIKRSVGNGHS